MYLFWHLVFALLLAVILCIVVVVPNPVWPYLLTVVANGVLIDVDHLLVWDPKYLSESFPTYFWEGLTFSVRTSVYHYILHLWVWPILLLAAALWLKTRSFMRMCC
jgi:hypothetical protein